MVFQQSNLDTTFTVWVQGALSGFGEATFAAPITVKGRSFPMNELHLPQAVQKKEPKSIYYLDQAVALGAYIAEGDFTADADPLSINSAHPILHTITRRAATGNVQVFKVIV